MAKKVFIAATGQNCGKTTLSVSLMHLARQKYGRVGFIKPLGPKIEKFGDLMVDMDAVLMAKTFGLEEDIALMNPVSLHKNFTRDYLSGKMDCRLLKAKVLEAFEVLEKKYDFLIIEGAGHGGVGSVIGLSNACVARTLSAPVIIVTDSGIGSAIDAVHLNLALYEHEEADVRMVVVNSSRDELIVTLSSLYHIPSYREKIVGLVIAGHVPTSEISQQILDDSNIPYIRVHESTANVFTTLSEDVAKITAEDQEKINWIKAN